jgi:hypothetical protein
MWRLLSKLVHPDAGGSDDLFTWVRSLHEHVAGYGIEEDVRTYAQGRQPPPHNDSSSTGDRLDFSAAYGVASFDDLTHRALEVAEKVGQPFRDLLRLLRDCRQSEEIALSCQQRQGATYQTLAAIGHAAGMSQAQRSRWYRIAESEPLSQRHAGHILGPLKRRAA